MVEHSAITTRTVYETEDGNQFENLRDAKRHAIMNDFVKHFENISIAETDEYNITSDEQTWNFILNNWGDISEFVAAYKNAE